jgi:hypothetical protein
MWDHLKYRNNYHALAMGNKIIAYGANLENQQGGIGVIAPYVVPYTVQCPTIVDIFIIAHHWEINDIKSKCFDCCELYTVFHIKNNLGADAGIVPLFHDKMLCAISMMKMNFGQLLLRCLSLSR